ncbi:MAG TPA: efflux transporter periplasmic adaptor subunit, partial [Syntrophorhabdus aromaticivorans]|nr:efflux transporter periplasmic adaptor subunit [Syntrophorhabdus aromaticivorans]
PGVKVEYWVDTYRDMRLSGKVDMIYPQPEIKDNIVYYLAIVKIDPKDTSLLRPEMTTHVRIMVEEKKDVLIVPNNVVRFEEGRNVVYIKGREKAESREVTPGVRDDRFTEIVSGLAEGEQVVIPSVVKKTSSSASSGPKK